MEGTKPGVNEVCGGTINEERNYPHPIEENNSEDKNVKVEGVIGSCAADFES